MLGMEQAYPEAFAARVYKISRDAQGNRLTHVKITGGKLKVLRSADKPDEGQGSRSMLGGKSQPDPHLFRSIVPKRQ